MNEIASPPRHQTTQTADGLARLKWSLTFGGIEGPRVPASAALTPSRLPELALSLGSLGLG